jgi:hypothetical protein
MFIDTTTIDHIKMPAFMEPIQEVIAASMKERELLRQNGGIGIGFKATDEDLKNNTITMYVDILIQPEPILVPYK